MKQNGSGQIIWPLPVHEQLRTKSCARCDGLLVTEWHPDLDNAGTHRIETLRWMQCGHRGDPVILQNQVRSPVDNQPVWLARSDSFPVLSSDVMAWRHRIVGRVLQWRGAIPSVRRRPILRRNLSVQGLGLGEMCGIQLLHLLRIISILLHSHR